MRPNMLNAALTLADRGRRVFPCVPAGDRAKCPLTPKGTPERPGGFHYATTDQDQIKTWWTRWPNAMIGGPVPLGMTVIDLDPYHGGTMEALEARTGPLPPTLTAWSGRGDGGRHLYFGRPTGELRDANLPKGFDLRDADKAYCILPPSIHPNTGKPYLWEGHPVADMPIGLVALLRPRVKDYTPVPHTPGPTVGKLAGLLRKMANERDKRQTMCWWVAVRLWENDYPRQAFDELRSAARSTGLPDWEIEHAIESAEKSAQKGRVAA